MSLLSPERRDIDTNHYQLLRHGELKDSFVSEGILNNSV